MDLDDLKREKRQKMQERDSLNAEIGRLEQKKAILDKAHARMVNVKRDYKNMKQCFENGNAHVTYWRGRNYTEFMSLCGAVTNNNNAVYKRIDAILDDINRKRNELWYQIGNKKGRLESVISKIWYLTTEIQNWFN